MSNSDRFKLISVLSLSFIFMVIHSDKLSGDSINSAITSKAPKLDGKYDDQCWEDALKAAEIKVPEIGKKVPLALACYDKDSVYFCFILEQSTAQQGLEETKKDEHKRAEQNSLELALWTEKENSTYSFSIHLNGKVSALRKTNDKTNEVLKNNIIAGVLPVKSGEHNLTVFECMIPLKQLDLVPGSKYLNRINIMKRFTPEDKNSKKTNWHDLVFAIKEDLEEQEYECIALVSKAMKEMNTNIEAYIALLADEVIADGKKFTKETVSTMLRKQKSGRQASFEFISAEPVDKESLPKQVVEGNLIIMLTARDVKNGSLEKGILVMKIIDSEWKIVGMYD